MIEEEYIASDTPPYEIHNSTVTIEGGYYLFNMIIVSVFAIGVLSGCTKVVSRVHKYMNDSRHTSSLDNYLLSHQVQDTNTEGQCSICIEPFNSTRTSVVLQCSHKFHEKCIKEWLEKELTCPNCRQPLLIN